MVPTDIEDRGKIDKERDFQTHALWRYGGRPEEGKGKGENASKRENLGKSRKIPIQVRRKKKAIISADEPPRSRVFVRGPKEVLSAAFFEANFCQLR